MNTMKKNGTLDSIKPLDLERNQGSNGLENLQRQINGELETDG